MASRSSTTGVSSAGSHRAPLSIDAARCQPSTTVIFPPSISKTRPVTFDDSTDPSHTTSAEMFAGSIASNEPSSGAAICAAIASPAPSVICVRADGAIALTVTP